MPQELQAPHSGVVGLHRSGPCALVLVFYPMDWEPVSREQLTLYQAFIDAFNRLGAHVLGISADHVPSHQAFARAAHSSAFRWWPIASHADGSPNCMGYSTRRKA